MISTQDELALYIPSLDISTQEGENSSYQKIKPYIETANNQLKNILGKDLFDEMANAADLKRICDGYTCNLGFAAGIPFLDLRATPAGFAVINNDNQAPASRDRVNALRAQVNEEADKYFDQLLIHILSDQSLATLWKNSSQYIYYTESLFITLADYRRYFNKSATRREMDEKHGVLMACQYEVADMLSIEYIDYLISASRNSTLNIDDLIIFSGAMACISVRERGEADRAYQMEERLVNRMRKNLDKYPTYATSEVYLLKKEDSFYKNKRHDKTFFF